MGISPFAFARICARPFSPLCKQSLKMSLGGNETKRSTKIEIGEREKAKDSITDGERERERERELLMLLLIRKDDESPAA